VLHLRFRIERLLPVQSIIPSPTRPLSDHPVFVCADVKVGLLVSLLVKTQQIAKIPVLIVTERLPPAQFPDCVEASHGFAERAQNVVTLKLLRGCVGDDAICDTSVCTSNKPDNLPVEDPVDNLSGFSPGSVVVLFAIPAPDWRDQCRSVGFHPRNTPIHAAGGDRVDLARKARRTAHRLGLVVAPTQPLPEKEENT
jgi:hypothetical protein